MHDIRFLSRGGEVVQGTGRLVKGIRGGRANALHTLLTDEQERGADFLCLANALPALYPKDSEGKRLFDAVFLAVRR